MGNFVPETYPFFRLTQAESCLPGGYKIFLGGTKLPSLNFCLFDNVIIIFLKFPPLELVTNSLACWNANSLIAHIIHLRELWIIFFPLKDKENPKKDDKLKFCTHFFHSKLKKKIHFPLWGKGNPARENHAEEGGKTIVKKKKKKKKKKYFLF